MDEFDGTEWRLRHGEQQPPGMAFRLNTNPRVTFNGKRLVGIIHTDQHSRIEHPDWPLLTYEQVLQAWQQDPHGRVIGMCQGCMIERIPTRAAA